ncbi:MAG TPA: tetratricopeptide repeat protein [Syntrophorhabdaceae bacterium]
MGEFHKTGAFRWLHLTDLHLGMPGQASLWPNVEEIFLNDLKFLRDNVGPWDMVLFTGDLTQRGTKPEFDELDKLLQTLWSRFKEWGFTPELLAIPGNHDLVRPENQVDPSLITLLKTWNVPEVQEPFWDDKRDSSQRALISAAFQNYAHWWKHTSIPKPATINRGFLPGDCSTSYTADDLNLGIVGLNSAYLQLGAGNFEKKLHLDVRQFHAACNGNGTVWTKQHDVCLLLTHHPEVWLNPEAQKQFLDEIYSPPERFALHQFGHMHDGNLSAVSHGGGSERRRLQGCSLFALESWGEEKKEKRNHGYSLCELKRENNELKLRIWPRRANEITGGGRTIDRDLSFDLEKHDGGTNPIVVKRLEPKHVVISDRTGAEAAPIDAPVSYDPRNPPFFVHYRQKGDQVIGRETALAKVRQQLTTGRPTAIGQTAVFQGLGGLGKTQLAVEYAHNYRDAYPNGVIWLTADQDLDAQLVDLAVEARWVAPASEHRHKLEVALHRLRSYSDCLIIFDNLEQLEVIKGYLPEPPAEPHILVTSRTEQPDFAYVPIDLLDSGQSLRMLTQEAGHQPEKASDWEAARKIAETLGGLPLALELAGAYLFRRPVSWQEYLKLLQYNLKIALPSRLSSLTGHEADLYSTLQISESVLTEEPQLQGILDVLTWSGPAPMGLDLLATLVGVEDHAELTNALSLGTALRILQHTPDTDSYALHRLVREVRREQNPLAERPTWAADLCQRTGDWFDAHRRDFAQLPRFESEIDHLREWHDHSLKFAPQQASRLTWLQAYPPFHRGQPREIKRLVEISHSEYDQHGCNDRPLLAHLNNDLAFSICELGDPKGALELAEQVLAVRRELFGERHPDTADSLNNVAICCGKLGDPKRALALAEQALAVRRGLFGERHPNTADSLNNVAGCQSELGNPKGALELSEQALAIRRELFGERHPNTADSLNNVAIYCSKLGDPKGALELAEQALAILRELFGERHPSTTNALSNVAMCHSALGNPKRALELSEQALAIQNELFGERHPSTATILYNMADYLRRLGNTSIAYAYAQKALEIETSIFGSQHSTTLKTAKLLSRIGRPGFRVPSLKKTTNKNKKGKARR